MRYLLLSAFLFLGLAPANAAGPSFACTKAQSDTEWAVCNTPTLAAWDARMAGLYAAKPPSRSARELQRKWMLGERNSCGGNVGCLMKVYEQRINFLEGAKGPPVKAQPFPVRTQPGTCSASELSIVDTDQGDAGMSKATNVFLIRYSGKTSCTLRGYPAIRVQDSSGAVQLDHAVYAGEAAYVRFAGPPRDVTLSAGSDAWFSLSSSSGCDAPHGKPGFDVDVALPASDTVLRRIRLPNATCGAVTVTPIGPSSAMKAALSP